MQTARQGSELKIHIRLALATLGRKPVIEKRMTIAEMKAMLAGLRKEQIERGIINPAMGR